ncbi:type VI secretion protein VasK, partial [Caballeronia jiangsuensis]
MTRKFKLDLVSTLFLVILPGLLVWLRPQWIGISVDSRGPVIVALCGVFIVLWLVLNYHEASRAATGYRAVKDWMFKRGVVPMDASRAVPKTGMGDIPGLKQWLVERHGWRWRNRESWILLIGDEALIGRLAPDLIESGYANVGGAILLYARETNVESEFQRLSGIRRLRRRRPVDAVVAVTCADPSGHEPFDAQALSQTLARLARGLRWAPPVYVLNAEEVDKNAVDLNEAIGFTWPSPNPSGEDVRASLQRLTYSLADVGVARVSRNPRDRSLAALSQHISMVQRALAELVTGVGRSNFVRSAVHGLFFLPLPQAVTVEGFPREAARDRRGVPETSRRAVWTSIAAHSRKVHGRPIGFSWSSATAWTTTAAIAVWLLGSMMSGTANRSAMLDAASSLSKTSSTNEPAQALFALDVLNKQLDTLEVHRKEGAPLHTRFGLNHDAELYHALWPAYQNAASRALIEPLRAKLEERLQQLASLSDAEIASGGNTQVQAAYDTLKTYLMLAHPEHADAAFLTAQLLATNAPTRPQNASITQGTWDDLRQ